MKIRNYAIRFGMKWGSFTSYITIPTKLGGSFFAQLVLYTLRGMFGIPRVVPFMVEKLG